MESRFKPRDNFKFKIINFDQIRNKTTKLTPPRTTSELGKTMKRPRRTSKSITRGKTKLTSRRPRKMLTWPTRRRRLNEWDCVSQTARGREGVPWFESSEMILYRKQQTLGEWTIFSESFKSIKFLCSDLKWLISKTRTIAVLVG